jgi:hypothetical protein
MRKQNHKSFTAIAAASLLAAFPNNAIAQTSPFEFGDDSSSASLDGECDDMRFEGDGMAVILLTDSIGRDATDCSKAFSTGTIWANPLFLEPSSIDDIDFGDDASMFAHDGECDDIRFVGEGSESYVFLSDDVAHDASDCRAGYETGELTWQGHRTDIERGTFILE